MNDDRQSVRCIFRSVFAVHVTSEKIDKRRRRLVPMIEGPLDRLQGRLADDFGKLLNDRFECPRFAHVDRILLGALENEES